MKLHDYDTVLTRLTIILSELYDGKKLKLDDLALEFGVSKRTIQRDFGERLNRFPIQKVDNLYGLDEEFIKGRFQNQNLDMQEQIVMDILENISQHISVKFEATAKTLFHKLKTSNENPMYMKLLIENMDDKIVELKMIEQAIEASFLIKFLHNNKQRLVHIK